nr:dihydrodipicolinate synthase family protein [Fredinandcohnia onubensis]
MKAYDLDRFRGVFVAFYSAYDEAEEVSIERVKKLARYYANTGIKGLYVGGSSGEGLLQTAEERMKVVEAVMEEVGEELTIIVHVGANSTKESIQLTKHAEKYGAHAVSAVPSIYYRLSEAAVEKHWKSMIESTSLPFIIYNIPQLTGFNLTQSLFKKMSSLDQVIGLKMSAESVYELQQFKANAGKDFLIFNGPDEQFLGGLVMGADGGIGGTYGVMPELFVALHDYYRKGEIEKAQQLQVKINDVITKLISYSSLYGACKYILSLRGIETGEPRGPLLPIPAKDYDSLEQLNNHILETIETYTKETVSI